MEEQDMTLDECIKEIRRLEHHDERNKQLYAALGHHDDPPYNKWVATWLIKCIRKGFKESYKADILLASFALLEGYTLQDTIEERLYRYVDESTYLERYPIKDTKQCSDSGKSQKDIIITKITRNERNYLRELITFIEDNVNTKCSVTHLERYGEEHKNKKGVVIAYSPKLQQISHPRCSRQNPKTEAGEPVDKSEMTIEVLQLMACAMQNIPKMFSELAKDKLDIVHEILLQPPEEQNNETTQEQYTKIIKIMQAVMGIAFFLIVCTKIVPIDNQENKENVVGQAPPPTECRPISPENTDEIGGKFELAHSILKQIIFLQNEICQEENDEEVY